MCLFILQYHKLFNRTTLTMLVNDGQHWILTICILETDVRDVDHMSSYSWYMWAYNISTSCSWLYIFKLDMCGHVFRYTFFFIICLV